MLPGGAESAGLRSGAGRGRRSVSRAARSGAGAAPRSPAAGRLGHTDLGPRLSLAQSRALASQDSCGAMAGPGPGDQDEHYDFLFKLVLVGDASVGKTCVVQRFKTGAFSARQGSTIGVDFTMKTLEIQGKRVKVGGGAARCFAPGGRFVASPSASPSFGTGLGLDVRAGFRSESTALGSGSGDSGRPERGGGSPHPTPVPTSHSLGTPNQLAVESNLRAVP